MQVTMNQEEGDTKGHDTTMEESMSTQEHCAPMDTEATLEATMQAAAKDTLSTQGKETQEIDKAEATNQQKHTLMITTSNPR